MGMTTRTAQAPQEQRTGRYRAHFEAFERALNGERSQPVHALRRHALARFEEIGFPTTRHEEWRFTNLAPLLRTDFVPVIEDTQGTVHTQSLAPFTLRGDAAAELVFVNGILSRELSRLPDLPAGLTIMDLQQALLEVPALLDLFGEPESLVGEQAFTALNTAFLQSGVFVSLAEGVTVEQPVHLLFVATGGGTPHLVQPRNLIRAARGSRLSIVETYAGLDGGTYMTNALTQLAVGEQAVLEHDTLQVESERSYHIGTMHARLAAGSTFRSNAVAFGGALVRNNVSAVYDGEGAHCVLNGLSLGTGTQLIDNHTAIDHARANCTSLEVYKAILDGKARGVFNGKIFVRRDAQKTDARQTNKTLLLSDDAVMNTKPQLEIFADDVKCTHGATVGQLDEEQVFYLRSRGIGADAARDLLTYAFADDVVERINVVSLRSRLEALLHGRLRQGRISTD